MTQPRTIDIHTHILTEETMRLLGREAPKVAPKLTPIDADSWMLEIAGTPYRPFPRGGFDVERRFRDMDAAEVDVHLLSVTPQTYLYDQDASLAATTSAIQNDQIAGLVKAHPDRFMGIATLPMQAPERAAEELTRAVRTLGMHGAMIGSNIMGKNLDDPSFEPLWAAAAELGAFMLIHPNNVAGIDRMRSYYLNNLIGNPLDTTIAAACLVFGGVMERYPNLKVLLVHGGGFVPYQAGRWVHGWHVRPEPKVNVKRVAGAVDRPVLLRHHPACETTAGIPGRLGRIVAGAARQRLSLRHGHRRMRAAGEGAVDRRRREGGDPQRQCGEAAGELNNTRAQLLRPHAGVRLTANGRGREFAAPPRG